MILKKKYQVFISFILLFAGILYFAFDKAEQNKMEQEQEVEYEIEEPEELEEIVARPPVQDPPPPQKPVRQAPIKVPESAKGPDAKYPNLDDSFVPFDKEGNRYIEHINQVGPHLVYHGDVLLGSSRDLERLMKNKVIKMAQPGKWTNGVIPYVIDEGLANYEKVMDAIEYLNLQTNIRIVPREDQENYVRVTLGRQDCYAYAGMIGGMQEIFLTPKCGVREILHEFMHTIGFFHEQNREDRDQYVKILWDNIDDNNKPQFKKIPDDFLGVKGRPFDFDSIMIYDSFTFAASSQDPVMLTLDDEIIPRTRSLLSNEDIKRINLAYPNID